jgi:hypothetical protein
MRFPTFSLAASLIATTALSLPALAVPPSKIDMRRLSTFANPLDLPYRYQPHTQPVRGKAPFREAADPHVIEFGGRYWMFASHSKGYWWSKDLVHWTFVEPIGFPVDKFAPSAVAIDGKLYVTVSEFANKVWVTDDPLVGHWTLAANVNAKYQDPELFRDDDGRLFLYEGLAGSGPLRVFELDPQSFQTIDKSDIPQSRNKEARGWEVPGDDNEQLTKQSYVEGSAMLKRNGRYYLEYSAPGTEFKTYANGLLVADKPMGPFVYQDYSPFAAKPSGFIAGAGHGKTFADMNGQYWHVGTMTISVRHPFERRLGLFPTSFTSTGEVVADTYLSDYPRYSDGDRSLTGWMLLSRKKKVTVSSTLEGYPADNAADEEVRTWWSAQTGGPGEWLQMDLGATKLIEAVQINFADQDSTGLGISKDVYRYVLELSTDGRRWHTAVNHAIEGRDSPHDYEVLQKPQRARYLRLRNVQSPDGSKFSLYDLRVFGHGNGTKADTVGGVSAVRDFADGRKAEIQWERARNAEFYVVRFGPRADLMPQNVQVYDGVTALKLNSLNVGTPYCFAVDAVNESGITRSEKATCVQ